MTEPEQGPETNSPTIASLEFADEITTLGDAPERADTFRLARRQGGDDLVVVLEALATVPEHVRIFIRVHGEKFTETFFKAIDGVADAGRKVILSLRDNGPAVLYEDNGTTIQVTVWGDPDLPDE